MLRAMLENDVPDHVLNDSLMRGRALVRRRFAMSVEPKSPESIQQRVYVRNAIKMNSRKVRCVATKTNFLLLFAVHHSELNARPLEHHRGILIIYDTVLARRNSVKEAVQNLLEFRKERLRCTLVNKNLPATRPLRPRPRNFHELR